MNKMTNQRFTQSVVAGAQMVIDHKEELNRINVFPVADGDTGSNLAALMQGIIDNLVLSEGALESQLNELATVALISARGNSGIIFAQFFSSVAEGFSGKTGTTENFIDALVYGVDKTYDSLADPKEGTILTVMRDWTTAFKLGYQGEQSLRDALLSAQKKAKQTLEDTEFQMAVLKKNRLVDSGGKGFYYFISGVTTNLLDGPKKKWLSSQEPVDLNIKVAPHHETEEPIFRYCSEFILKNITSSKESVISGIKGKGDSLIVAGNDRQVKIHLHTNHPQDVLKVLLSHGEISYQKVDDMSKQYQVSKNRRRPIAIVTDSVADLPEEWVTTYQIHIIPMNILVGNQNYLDKLTIGTDAMAQSLGKGEKISTAQPSIQTVDALLSFLQGKYDHVLVLTVSQKLSGTYQLMNQRIKERQLSTDWIKVIDSRLNTVAQGLLVKKAAEIVDEEDNFEKIVASVEQLREKIFIYVAVDDLSPMIASGRIPKFIGNLARKLSLHPIVSLDMEGNGRLTGVTLTQNQSVKKINKKIKRLMNHQHLTDSLMTHVDAKNGAVAWQKELGETLLVFPEVIDCSAVIATSAGVGCMAIAGVLEEEKI